MGTWGTGLYEDDYAQDVRQEYLELLQARMKPREIAAELREMADGIPEDSEDALIFWLALADTQWEYGRLTEKVLQEANRRLADGGDAARWEEQSSELAAQRRAELERIRARINSPMPPKKRIVRRKGYQCDWKDYDVFSYVLDSDEAQYKGVSLKDCQVFLVKVDETDGWPNRRIPIVWTKLSHSLAPVTTFEQLEQLEFVMTGTANRCQHPEWPSLNETHQLNAPPMPPKRERVTKTGFRYESYPYYYKPYEVSPIYRARLETQKASEIPEKLIYIGNFPNLTPPKYDLNPLLEGAECGMRIPSIYWADLERDIVLHYYYYTLRNSPYFSLERMD